MAWTMLLLAALLEVAWAIGLKYTHGFTKLWPSLWTVLAMVLSMALLVVVGANAADWHGICGLDRNRRGRNGCARRLLLWRGRECRQGRGRWV